MQRHRTGLVRFVVGTAPAGEALPIVWNAYWKYTCNAVFSELASVAVNGTCVGAPRACPGALLSGAAGISIPANRTSTVIFVASGGQAAGTPSIRSSRSTTTRSPSPPASISSTTSRRLPAAGSSRVRTWSFLGCRTCQKTAPGKCFS